MSSLTTVPFQAVHADWIVLREHERELIDIEALQQKYATGWVGTVIMDGRVLAFIGFFEMWPGVAEVFVMPSIYIHKYAKTFVKYIRNMLKQLEDGHNFHRMQTFSLADHQTDKWMRCLGFQCEGTLDCFTQTKVNYRLWARLRK